MAGDAVKPKLDTSKIYYATREELEAAKARASIRQSAKAEFQKKYTNPLKGVSGGGYIFDPSMQRFMSMKVSLYDSHRATPRNTWAFLWTTVIPIFAIYKYLTHELDTREKVFRSGAVPYKERFITYFIERAYKMDLLK
ncbi:hypothetical protein EB796_025175 [Bugula neritina]|uniref:NADH dehydrogenase [ubiquinone] 1 beta subcomplex subunit 4 n=1 Tax=Bugula neritina TaxID=10212 RepID=A0A7J7IRJ6_BUGNE|nr:hypothetical protein EB796_025175 [Bugula neritina]